MKQKIKPEHYQKLMKLNDKKLALEQFIQTVVQEGKRQIAEANVEGRQIWGEIKADNAAIDFDNVDWAPSVTEPDTLIAIQQRFFPRQ